MRSEPEGSDRIDLTFIFKNNGNEISGNRIHRFIVQHGFTAM